MKKFRAPKFDHPKITKDVDLLKADILYENHPYTVRLADHGFDVYCSNITHSVRCAIIGYHGVEGFEKALSEIGRRMQNGN